MHIGLSQSQVNENICQIYVLTYNRIYNMFKTVSPGHS